MVTVQENPNKPQKKKMGLKGPERYKGIQGAESLPKKLQHETVLKTVKNARGKNK